FQGLLAKLAGAKVSQSSVIYDSDGKTTGPTGGETAFLVDFGTSVSVTALQLKTSTYRITLVLPWLGMDFSPRAAYPSPGGANPQAPAPDGTGETRIGLPGVETSKLLVQVKGTSLPSAAQFPQQCRLTTGTYPTNVNASPDRR